MWVRGVSEGLQSESIAWTFNQASRHPRLIALILRSKNFRTLKCCKMSMMPMKRTTCSGPDLGSPRERVKVAECRNQLEGKSKALGRRSRVDGWRCVCVCVRVCACVCMCALVRVSESGTHPLA